MTSFWPAWSRLCRLLMTSCLKFSGRNGRIDAEVSQSNFWPLKWIHLNLTRGECFPNKIWSISFDLACSWYIRSGLISVIVVFRAARFGDALEIADEGDGQAEREAMTSSEGRYASPSGTPFGRLNWSAVRLILFLIVDEMLQGHLPVDLEQWRHPKYYGGQSRP